MLSGLSYLRTVALALAALLLLCTLSITCPMYVSELTVVFDGKDEIENSSLLNAWWTHSLKPFGSFGGRAILKLILELGVVNVLLNSIVIPKLSSIMSLNWVN